jgi:hypothetical protein
LSDGGEVHLAPLAPARRVLRLGMALVKAGLSRTVPAFTFILEETRRRAGLVALRRQLKAELKQQLNKPWISGPRQVSE